MKHALDDAHPPIGWGTAALLALVSVPLAAIAVLVVRTFLVPLVVGGVAVLALLALFVPPRFRDWLGQAWRLPHP